MRPRVRSKESTRTGGKPSCDPLRYHPLELSSCDCLGLRHYGPEGRDEPLVPLVLSGEEIVVSKLPVEEVVPARSNLRSGATQGGSEHDVNNQIPPGRSKLAALESSAGIKAGLILNSHSDGLNPGGGCPPLEYDHLP